MLVSDGICSPNLYRFLRRSVYRTMVVPELCSAWNRLRSSDCCSCRKGANIGVCGNLEASGLWDHLYLVSFDHSCDRLRHYRSNCLWLFRQVHITVLRQPNPPLCFLCIDLFILYRTGLVSCEPTQTQALEALSEALGVRLQSPRKPTGPGRPIPRHLP